MKTSSSLIALLIFASGFSPVQTAAAPSSAAASAYLQGQASERFFQDHVMAGTCGIVLERPRCVADFRAFRAARGPDPSDTAIEAWLATGDFSQRVKDWNGIYISDKAWLADPESSWWFTAGQISISASMPQNDASSAYVTHSLDDLTAHPDSTPAEFRDLILPTGSEFTRLAPLQSALLKTIPVVPYPDVAVASGARGDVQLGIKYATLQQLIDNPIALSRPESRAFGLAIINTLQTLNDKYGEAVSFSTVRNALEGQIPDGQDIDTLRRGLAHSVSPKWPLKRREAFLIGAALAQVAYNAAVLRNGDDDKSFRRILAQIPPFAGASTEVRSDVKALLAIPPAASGGNWNAINAAASKAVMTVVSE
jgi:hypothetical protein